LLSKAPSLSFKTLHIRMRHWFILLEKQDWWTCGSLLDSMLILFNSSTHMLSSFSLPFQVSLSWLPCFSFAVSDWPLCLLCLLIVMQTLPKMGQSSCEDQRMKKSTMPHLTS
jgi:hypothetical protein